MKTRKQNVSYLTSVILRNHLGCLCLKFELEGVIFLFDKYIFQFLHKLLLIVNNILEIQPFISVK